MVAAWHEELTLSKTVSLRGHLDDSAGEPAASIAGRLSLQVIGFFVDDDSFVQDRIGSFEREPAKDAFETGHALFVSLEVAEVANVFLGIGGRAVLGVRGIEMAAGGREIRRRAIALFVNVKAVLAGSEPLDVRGDTHALGFLAEGHLAFYFAIRRGA